MQAPWRIWVAAGTAGMVMFALIAPGCGAGSESEPPGSGGTTGHGGTTPTGGSGGANCSDELCDGLDNDCDGTIDEDCPCTDGQTQDCYSGDPALVGVGECANGTQTCDLQGVWGPCEGEVLPLEESCDGNDDDCDGTADEDLGSVTCGLGVCQVTVPACEDGQPVPCVPLPAEPPEDCDQFDDDCDGEVDEDCDCTPDGLTEPCYSGAPSTLDVGECHGGDKTCLNGTWGACLGDQTPVSELCDGLDNDCNDQVDNGDPGGGGACDTGVPGICAAGTWHCIGGTVTCVQDQQPSEDLCDTLDNDCNPGTADGFDHPGVGDPCDGADSDLCEEGARVCTGGQVVCTDYTGNVADLCDGLDNDCDAGSADGSEDPQNGIPCDGADSDLCVEGTRICINGGFQCSDNSGNTVDTCDGLDNDCDAASSDGSEDPLVGIPCDGADGDLCNEGTSSCSGGAVVCSDASTNNLDLCDGQDNDCDPASVDGAEDPQVGSACDGQDSDLCQEGTRSCAGGALSCSDNTGNNLDMCDGVDNDCDAASADGAEDPQVGTACDGSDPDLCFDGLYVCSSSVVTCNDGPGTGLDICDGIDNDCNANTPDGSQDPLIGAPCDGPDSDLCTEGIYACAAGVLSCSDNTGHALDICDGLDNDCDPASADGAEDALVGISCDGADSDLCKEGSSSCVAGSVVCSDNSGGTVDSCDGQDNDCDPASADGSEDAQVGVTCDGPDSDLCKEGTSSCVAGSVVCSDGSGSTVDLCNGADDDCDPASADGSEDALVGVTCDGADSDLCKEGTSSCNGGAVVCSDNSGSTVDTCNGADDDCDAASADGAEDPLVGVSCDGPDSDLCNEGFTSCIGGAVVCSDSTGNNLDLCNGANDDCDAASADGAEDPLVGLACDGADSDLCQEGASTCNGGAVVCSDNSGSTVDICNGANDDCDPASADGSEDPLVGVACDGADSDLCNEGTSSCSAGAVVCNDNSGHNLDICDGLDNDCDAASADGSEDASVGVACDGPDSDLCTEGTSTCSAGSILCGDTTGNTLDVCNGVNDDCDPASADGSEDAQVGTPCDGPDNDLCTEGTRSCSGGALVCSDNTGNSLDVCDGVNNDCDAASADGSEDPLVGIACDGSDSDLCTEGTSSCSGGVIACSDNTGSALDVCNGLDDDCDPVSADGSEDPLNGTACDGTDSDLCTEGTRSCSGGALACSDNTSSTVDLCNGLDDDCDGASPDGSEDPQVGVSCDGSDSDLCQEGSRVCIGGALSCSDNTSNNLDVCNGLDDDCDAASADGAEDPLNGQSCDGTDSDLCLEGTRSCSGGALACSDVSGSTVDLCNGTDDDCDPASADGSEDPSNGQACDGTDADLCLEGSRYCSGGSLQCSDTTGSTYETCNGLDDDCDSSIDEDGVCSTCGNYCYYYTGSCSSTYIGTCDGCDMGCAVHDPDCDGSPCMAACSCLLGYSNWYCDGWDDCADPACECAGE